MLVVQIVILGIMLLVVPTLIGTLFNEVNKGKGSIAFAWISGQVLLWAGFFAICIPFILLQGKFTNVCILFGIYSGVLLIVAMIIRAISCAHGGRFWGDRQVLKVVAGTEKKKSWYLLWIVFGLLLIVQLALTVFLAYEEGDDAFYVAISTTTVDADTMYCKLPYTGSTTGLDARHGLAPFPIWVAFLAKVSGMAAVSVAQIILPVVLTAMAYTIYYLIGTRLCTGDERELPFFLILVEVLILFGGYSTYSAENFLLVRASQGKAVMANIVIPFLFYLLWLLLNKLQKEEKMGIPYWTILMLTMIAGCLCSTLGTVLTCMLTGIVGVCAAVGYRKVKVLFPMALCCIVPVVMALLYFWLD